ncbi:uncharacterized protein [Erythrolamprus reginae]|uniref:uncharacterized protein n=1 Tax=Erythrolamprus reginae TaxID=121349 RepID=UPI00396CC5AD
MEPGDLIEIFRRGYEHWAVYVGDDDVVHLAGRSESAGASSSLFMGFPAVVKKEKLSDVVGKNRYRVNNKYDSKYRVRDPKDIVSLANGLIGERIKYNLITENYEHFAYYLRYCVPVTDQVRFWWEEPSNKVDMELGDLIEIFRRGYEHWAVYVGDGDVVHLAGRSESAGARSSWFWAITAVVKKEKLSDVVGKNRYHVNNKYDSKYRVRDPKDIVSLANGLIGERIKYKLITENYEHFAYYLRYCVPVSDQVRFWWEEPSNKVFHFGLLLAAVGGLLMFLTLKI